MGSPYASIDSMGPLVEELAVRHIDICFRDLIRGPAAEVTGGSFRLLTGEAHPFGNIALISQVDDLRVVEEVVDSFVAASIPAAVLLLRRPDTAIEVLLNSKGFASHGASPAMAADTNALQPGALPAGYDFHRVRGPAESGQWVQAVAEGYPIPSSMARLFSPESLGADTEPGASVQFFVILRDGRPVSASMMYLAAGVAGMYFVATVPDERGKGLGSYVTAEPLRIARRLGYGVAVLQASPQGETVYRKLGFEQYASVPVFLRLPG
jgi:GNAT superfamily N-acetyltransferase